MGVKGLAVTLAARVDRTAGDAIAVDDGRASRPPFAPRGGRGVWGRWLFPVAAALFLMIAGSASADTWTFSYTGGEQQFPVPSTATQLSVTAVGGAGGSVPNVGLGGEGAIVSGGLPVTPRSPVIPGGILYVEVGGNASGFNGGGGGSGRVAPGAVCTASAVGRAAAAAVFTAAAAEALARSPPTERSGPAVAGAAAGRRWFLPVARSALTRLARRPRLRSRLPRLLIRRGTRIA